MPVEPPDVKGLLPGRGPAEREPPGLGAAGRGAPGFGAPGLAAAGLAAPPEPGAGRCAGGGVNSGLAGPGRGAEAPGLGAGVEPPGLGALLVGSSAAGLGPGRGPGVAPGFGAAGAAGVAGGVADAPGLGAPGLGADAFFGAAGFAAGFLVPVAPPAPNASVSLRTTGASIVEDAERTNSPNSWSLAMTTLLSTPSSLASSYTRTLATSLLLVRGDVRRTFATYAWALIAYSSSAHRNLDLLPTRELPPAR